MSIHTCRQFFSILILKQQYCIGLKNILRMVTSILQNQMSMLSYAEKCAVNLSFILSQLKQGRKLFGKTWKLTRKLRTPEKKLDSLSNIQRQTDLGTLVFPFINPTITYIDIVHKAQPAHSKFKSFDFGFKMAFENLTTVGI